MASFFIGHLPAEIIAPIYKAILASKYEFQGVEDPWYRVNEQIRFSAMISACGVEHEPDHDGTSRDQSPCPSLLPMTEISENERIDYTQAIHLDWALDSKDVRYQDHCVENLAPDNDIAKDLSPEPCLAVEQKAVHDEFTAVAQSRKRKRKRRRSDNIFEESTVSHIDKKT